MMVNPGKFQAIIIDKKKKCHTNETFKIGDKKLRPKKEVLFPEIGRVKNCLSVTRQHSRICIRIYIFNFKKHQTNKQTKKKTRIEKSKRNWTRKDSISRKSIKKKKIGGRPGEDFSCHPTFFALETRYFLVKLLGVQIDDQLKFNLHISNICRSAANQLNALIRLKRFLAFEEKKTLINSYFYSNFNYCP